MGQISAAVSLVPLTFAVVESSRYGWESPVVMMGFAGFTVFSLMFVPVENASINRCYRRPCSRYQRSS